MVEGYKAKLLFKEDAENPHIRFERELGVTITDGKEVVPTLPKTLSPGVWGSLISEFLHRL